MTQREATEECVNIKHEGVRNADGLTPGRAYLFKS